MNASQWFLLSGGGVGAAVSLIHGAVMGPAILRPIDAALAGHAAMHVAGRKLVTPLLHYSTFAWLLGGIAVMLAAALMGPEARRAVGLLAGASYLYAAGFNLWATRGVHPGGWLMVLAVCLIAYGLLRD
jgi:hypothetical protein